MFTIQSALICGFLKRFQPACSTCEKRVECWTQAIVQSTCNSAGQLETSTIITLSYTISIGSAVYRADRYNRLSSCARWTIMRLWKGTHECKADKICLMVHCDQSWKHPYSASCSHPQQANLPRWLSRIKNAAHYAMLPHEYQRTLCCSLELSQLFTLISWHTDD